MASAPRERKAVIGYGAVDMVEMGLGSSGWMYLLKRQQGSATLKESGRKRGNVPNGINGPDVLAVSLVHVPVRFADLEVEFANHRLLDRLAGAPMRL